MTAEQNQEAIEVLQAVGIMTGDGNGSFNPDANVTRNEMAVIMSNLMDYRAANYKGTSPFSDVPSWAEPYVAACCTNGITSGIGGNLYGGDQEVTTAQAALMMLKALGYFQYQNDFGADWMLSTVSKANSVDLLVDVASGARDAMTWNDVAQLVLNTPESGTVVADTSGVMNGNVNGASFTMGETKYDYITSTQDYARSIKTVKSTTNVSDANQYVVELSEKLYQGDLTREVDHDDTGRPSTIWEYKTKEIGTYSDKTDYTWNKKVTSKTLYNAVGRTATDNFTCDTKQFEEDQVVMYAYSKGTNSIQEVYPAEFMEGDVTQVRSSTNDGEENEGDNFVTGGTTHSYNATMLTKDRLLLENVNNPMAGYKDRYGYVAYIDKAAVTYDHAYVLSMGTDNDTWGNENTGSATKGSSIYARLVLTDGTVVKVQTNLRASDAKDVNGKDVWAPWNGTGFMGSTRLENRKATIDTGTVTLSDLYLKNGVAGFNITPADTGKARTWYTANSNTQFIIAAKDEDNYDDYTYSVYQGIANVPDVE